MKRIDFAVRGDHITLDALIKACGLADSGGAAKAMVAAGKVEVDGQMELRKTCKLRAGQVVALAGTRIHLGAQPDEAAEPEGSVSAASTTSRPGSAAPRPAPRARRGASASPAGRRSGTGR